MVNIVWVNQFTKKREGEGKKYF